MGIGGSTPPWQRNVEGVLPTMPIFGWGGGGIWRKKRKQVQLISVGRKAEGVSPHRTNNARLCVAVPDTAF